MVRRQTHGQNQKPIRPNLKAVQAHELIDLLKQLIGRTNGTQRVKFLDVAVHEGHGVSVELLTRRPLKLDEFVEVIRARAAGLIKT